MNKSILVIGGSGMLGFPVAERFVDGGYHVTIMTTNVKKTRPMFDDDVKVIEGDVTNPASLKKAIKGKDWVYINLNSKMDPALYESLEIAGTQNIAKVAKEMGVKRIGMISGASSRGVENGIIYLDGKVKAEKAIIESGVPYSIFRPSFFFETLPHFIQQGKAVILGEQPCEFGWIAASDYARQVVTAFEKDEAANQCFYNLGPDKMTIKDALEIYCKKFHPDLHPDVIGFGMAKMAANMPGMEKLKLAIPFFEYFSEMEEDVDPEPANITLGPNKTDIYQWLIKDEIEM